MWQLIFRQVGSEKRSKCALIDFEISIFNNIELEREQHWQYQRIVTGVSRHGEKRSPTSIAPISLYWITMASKQVITGCDPFRISKQKNGMYSLHTGGWTKENANFRELRFLSFSIFENDQWAYLPISSNGNLTLKQIIRSSLSRINNI